MSSIDPRTTTDFTTRLEKETGIALVLYRIGY